MQAVANAIADRISLISVSSTMKVAAEAERLRAEGVDIVDFGAGEPDFPTPQNIKQAAIRGRRKLYEVHQYRRHGRLEAGRVRVSREAFRNELQTGRVPHHGGRQAHHL